jgi:hypothetical protein
MTDDVERGAIFAEEAYALGKMLDHSCWSKQGEQSCWQKDSMPLPRLITPSDLDSVFSRLVEPHAVPTVFDDNGCMIFAELSTNADDWRFLSTGQYRLYRGLLEGPHCAVLCRHGIRPEQKKKICTRHDIISFQPMVWDHGAVIGATSHGRVWEDFVFKWFEDPLRVRRRIIGYSVGLKDAPNLKIVSTT